MRRIWFWLRWSARELRRRWVQVVVIALIIAVGTGTQAGLGSTSAWRQESYDASYAALHMFDLRVSLSDGSFVPRGELLSALGAMGHPAWVAGAEERLVLPTQVDASTNGKTILVPGRIVGVDVSTGGPRVNGIDVVNGRVLSPQDDGRPVAILEAHFARHYDLPAQGGLKLAGGVPVRYVGTGYSPEYFMVTEETVGLGVWAEANLAVVFMPLRSAGAIGGRDGMVNDLVLTLATGVDREAARDEIGRALETGLPGVGASVITREEDTAYRLLYGDLDSDQGTLNALAFLLFLAAVFAAFNLTSRIVEAQRREIGIGMALGARPRTIAVRPLLVGAEIAFLGVAFGVGMGMLVATGMRSALSDLMPLPIWRTDFQPGRFSGAAAIGFLLPFLATIWPVWRAVRVQPVQAIRTGHLAARGGGLGPLLRRIPLPGGTFGEMPIRNVMRAPRRTVLTSIGIAAAIMSLVGLVGLLDSTAATIDRTSDELLAGAPERVQVDLAGFFPADSPVVAAVTGSSAVGEAEPVLRLGGSVSGPSGFELLIDVLDLESPVWHPTISDHVEQGGLPGIVLAEKAAEDLGVRAGDTVVVRHPVRTGELSFGMTETPMRVVGLHPSPMRPFAYVDVSDAGVFGLAGTTNSVQVIPTAGSSVDDVKRAMFGLPGVTSVQPVDAQARSLEEVIGSFSGIVRVIELFALLLAALIAFNAASISADERKREHATMFAFGMRLRTLLRMTSVESLFVGLLGTAVGLGLGVATLGALVRQNLEEAPEIGMSPSLSAGSVLLAVALGVLAALIAPLLTARKLRRMDVASTLRVME